MNAALAALQAGIEDLRWYLEALDIEWKLLAAPHATPPCSPSDEQAQRLQQHIGTGAAKRRFDYNSVIISLYGLLEQYVESLVRGYVAALNAIVPLYGELPDAIKNSHVSLSMTLLNKASQSRYRGTVTAEGLISSLHSCLSNAIPYRLNTDAFSHHAANFRAEMVDEILAKVGVGAVSQRLRVFSPFGEYLAQEHPNRDLSKITPEEMYYYLNDLAERRNEVAHGSPSQLLSNQILRDYVKFIDNYCAALYEIAQCQFAEYLVKHKGTELGAPILVINNSIVCLELINTQIAQGDTLVAATGNPERPFMVGAIQEIQVSNQPLQRVAAAPSVKVGVKVLFKAKQNYRYVLVARP